MKKTTEEFIKDIPKAELHLHIEGTFEPGLMFEIAKRNNKEIKYKTVDEIKKAYNFNNLQEFLDIYYSGASVLVTEKDFYDLTWAYLEKMHSQNVLHVEIFFDPQTHTERGISFETVIRGIDKALKDGQKKLNISSKLIMSFLRHLSEEKAFEILEESMKYKDVITAVGLDSSEIGNPPSKFEKVFKKALGEGFLTVAHAGEEGSFEYINEALDLLKVSRVDHGNNSLDNESLMNRLAENKIPLTLCPLSNLKLKVVNDLKDHPMRKMIDKKILVTINSDDPAYFGGYLNENYIEIARALKFSKEEIVDLAKNSFKASFLNDDEKQYFINKIDKYYNNFKD